MKRCLIVVDYQNDFVAGTLGNQYAKNIESAICKKINSAHQNGDTVIFTFDTHSENYMDTLEGKYLPIAHCINNTPGHELYGQVAQLATKEDIFIEKHTFPSDTLLTYLQQNPVDQVELCGVVTNICVISNAIIAKAALPNAEIVIDKKAVASNDTAIEQKCFDILPALHIQVIE